MAAARAREASCVLDAPAQGHQFAQCPPGSKSQAFRVAKFATSNRSTGSVQGGAQVECLCSRQRVFGFRSRWRISTSTTP